MSDSCFRCGIEVACFLHCTWLQTKKKPFWRYICSTLTKITGVEVPVNPELCLLQNLTSIHDSLNQTQLKFKETAECVAKKCITVSWKSDSLFLIDRLLLEMNKCKPLEKITHSLRKQYNTFLKIWHPYLDYTNLSVIPSVRINQ